MTFDLKIEPENGPIWLRMTGPSGTREVLDAELSLQGPATPACGCAKTGSVDQSKVRWATAGAVVASLGICAASCLLPAALIGLGVAGSFVGALDSLSPYRWYFVVVTVVLLRYGFYTVYWRPRTACAAGAACKSCGSGRAVRIALWLGTAIAVSGVLYGYLEPWLTHR